MQNFLPKKIFFHVFIFTTFLYPTGYSLAYVSASSNYRIEADNISLSGDVESSSNYIINDSARVVSGSEPLVTTQQTTQPQTSAPAASLAVGGNGQIIISDRIPPANVSNLKVIYGREGVSLNWVNPKDPDFNLVYVVRSEKFYPMNPSDGKLIYSGGGTNIIDSGVISGVTYYYTVFAADSYRNYSSGSLKSVLIVAAETAIKEEEKEIIKEVVPVVVPEVIETGAITPVERRPLSVFDFNLAQGDQRLGPISTDVGSVFEVNIGESLKISLDISRIPDTVKTMIVSLQNNKDPEDSSLYLFKLNDEQTSYEAVIDEFVKEGKYSAYVSLLDNKNQYIQKVDLGIDVKEKIPTKMESENIFRKIIDFIVNIVVSVIKFFRAVIGW